MIRPLEAKDRELFLELIDEFYHSDAVLHATPVEYHINIFEEALRSDTYLLCYIIEPAGTPAGYGLLSKSFSPEVGGPIVWFEELYLREPFRNQGLGTAFFDFVESTIPAARYRLEVEPDNENALQMYYARGYEDLGYLQMVKDEKKL